MSAKKASIMSATKSLTKSLTKSSTKSLVKYNKITFYVVLVVTIFALISQLMTGQLLVVGIFALVAGFTSLVNENPTVIMLTALIIAGLFIMILTKTEGFVDPDKKPTNNDTMDESTVKAGGNEATVNPVPKDKTKAATVMPLSMGDSSEKVPAKDPFSGFRENFEQAKDISDALVKLEPMANTISDLMNKLDPALLDKALNSFKARR